MAAPSGVLFLLVEDRAVGRHALKGRRKAQTASQPTAKDCGGLFLFR
jgi:hypothetical protein